MAAQRAAAAPFLELFDARDICIYPDTVYFSEKWVLRARRKKRGQKGRETVHSSTLDVQLPTRANQEVKEGSPVWLEFAEKVKLYWCREKRERFADSLQMEQVPRVILPRSPRPALPPRAQAAGASPDGRLHNGGHSTIALPRKRKRDADERVIANAIIQLQRKRRAQYQVEQLALLEMPDDMQTVVLQRRVLDSKDGVTFGDSMKW